MKQASLDSQDEDDCEIVPIKLSSPEEKKKIWEGKNESVRSRQNLVLQLLLVITAFIWETRIGCYGNGLIDVEEKPKILERFWRDIRSGICPPTPPLTQHFALSKTQILTLS